MKQYDLQKLRIDKIATPSTIPSGSKRINSIVGGTMKASLNSFAASHTPPGTGFVGADDIRSI